MASLIVWIWLCSSRASLVVTLAATTARDTPQARPSAILDGTNTYGTFCRVSKRYGARTRTLSSHSSGRCSTISIGSTSAAMTMNSQMPRFSVLVASLAPFLSCL